MIPQFNVHRGLTLNTFLPGLIGVKFCMLIYVSPGYHNLKLDDKSSYLTFECLFDKYQYVRLPFQASPVGDIFQKKISQLFSSMLNVTGIADDILIAGFD